MKRQYNDIDNLIINFDKININSQSNKKQKLNTNIIVYDKINICLYKLLLYKNQITNNTSSVIYEFES